MLFNLEMISGFLANFDTSVQYMDTNWTINSILLSEMDSIPGKDELFVSSDGKNDVICISQSGKIIVHDASLLSVFNSIVKGMNYYNSWEKDALNAVSSDTTAREYVELLCRLFPGYSVKIVDTLGRMLFSSDKMDDWEAKPMDPVIMNLIRNIPACHKISLGIRGVTSFWSKYFRRQFLFGNFVFHDGSYLIFSVSKDGMEINDTHVHLGVIAQNIFERGNFSNAELLSLNPFRNYCMRLLDGQRVENTYFTNLEALIGWRISDLAYLVLIGGSSADDFAGKALPITLAEKLPHSFSFSYKENIVCMIPKHESAKNLPAIGEQIVPLGFKAGVSLPLSDWNDIPKAYQQAQLALSNSGNDSAVNMCEKKLWRYYLEMLIENGGKNIIHPDVIETSVSVTMNDTMRRTLYCYLRNNCSMVETSRALDIHINTLKYRIGKIREAIDFNPDDYESRMAFLLSYDLQNMLNNQLSE